VAQGFFPDFLPLPPHAEIHLRRRAGPRLPTRRIRLRCLAALSAHRRPRAGPRSRHSAGGRRDSERCRSRGLRARRTDPPIARIGWKNLARRNANSARKCHRAGNSRRAAPRRAAVETRRRAPRGRLLAEDRGRSRRPLHRGHRVQSARRALRRLRPAAQDRARRARRFARRPQYALRAHPLGEPLGQSGWLHRARLRRPLHLLGKRPRARRPGSRRRLRAAARFARHQRLLHQQRQRRPAPADPGDDRGSRAHRRRVPPLGRSGGAIGRSFEPQDSRRPGYLRSARRRRRRLVETKSR
jgi:hypothetical protein